MSKFLDFELSSIDVEWYGVDKNENIAVLCSAGEAYVPEFVYSNKERYETLMKLFRELPVTTESEVKFECSKKNVKPLQVVREFSGRGLFYYDSDDHSKSARNICVLQKYYTLCSIPKTPIKFSELPLQMQKLLEDSILDVDDFGKSKMIDIKCDVDKDLNE